MKPAYAIYLLEVKWVNDHSNTEFATLTVEGREGHRYEKGFEELVDPLVSDERKDVVMAELHEVAHALRRHYGGWHTIKVLPADLVRLYRVVDQEKVHVRGAGGSAELRELHLKLTTICEFDRDGKPVTPKQTAAA